MKTKSSSFYSNKRGLTVSTKTTNKWSRFCSALLALLLAAGNITSGQASTVRSGTLSVPASTQGVSSQAILPRVYFDGQLINENLADSIARDPLIAWGFVEEQDANGNITYKEGELWFIVTKGVTVDYYHLSDDPSSSATSPVNYGGYTILAFVSSSIAGTSDTDEIAAFIVTKQLWINSSVLGINPLLNNGLNRSLSRNSAGRTSASRSAQPGTANLNALSAITASTSTAVWGDPHVNERSNLSTASLSSQQMSGTRAQLSNSAQLGSQAASLATQTIATRGISSANTGQQSSIVAGASVSTLRPTVTSSSVAGSFGSRGTFTQAIPQTLEYMGYIVERIEYSSSTDNSINMDFYDAQGQLYTSFGYTVIASSPEETAAQLQACEQQADDVQWALDLWTDITSLAAEALGGLLAAGAEFITGGTATPFIATGGVVYTAAVGGINLFHKNVTVPLIAGAVESHCKGNVIDSTDLADYIITPEPVSLNYEYVPVCDEYAIQAEFDSSAQDVAPGDDADYEVVVTGSESGTLVCTEWHYELVPVD